MYKKDEELILLADKGTEGEKGFLPEGTKLKFVRAVDYGFKSMVVVQHEDTVLVLPELAVRPTKTNTLAVLRDFNNELAKNNPELKKYHHNVFKRIYYRIKRFFKELLTRDKQEVKVEQDLSNIKKILNEGGEVE